MALDTFDKKPKIWLRYIDDIFCIWSHGLEQLHKFMGHINSKSSTIKVTLEIEKNGSLPFLDVNLTKKSDKLHTTIYRKPTNTGKYLNYQSNYAECVKFGLAYGLINRAKVICSEKDSLKKELKKLGHELAENGYPKKVIDKAMNHIPKSKTNHYTPYPYLTLKDFQKKLEE